MELTDINIKFETLPEGLRQQYYNSPLVHSYIAAYLLGKIEREPMLAELASALAIQQSETMNQYIRMVEWFGMPPPKTPKLFPNEY